MSDAGAGEKLKIFISYSRKDSAAFVDELVPGLEVAGFAPFLDRFDIAAGEEWEARLGGLIAQSDTVVFVISPEAVKSEQCTREVDRTHALSKRLLPVVFKKVPERDVPEKLRRLQWIYFDGQPGFTRPLLQLAEALRVDLLWIRDHTRLAERATDWDERGRPESLLLRGDAVDAAKRWMADRKAGAPEITEAQRAFVKASREAETTRLEEERAQIEVIRKAQEATAQQQRRIGRLLGGLAMLVGGSILGIIAWFNQSRIEQVWNEHWNVEPYRRANFDKYVLPAARERGLKEGDAFRECAKNCPEMIVVPAGDFLMGPLPTEKGDDDEEPRHAVTIAKRIAVSRFAVTFADWDACVSVGGCPQEGRANDAGWGRGTRPVINVSWDDAQAYVAWLSRMTGKAYRLLSEAEWEYAARAGSTTAYFWGEEIGKNNANCNGCGSQWDARQTSPVESFKPNDFGLHDMAGNVFQWAQDCYHGNYDGAPDDGSAWISGDCGFRVVRGGSWYGNPQNLRSAYRNRYSPSGRLNDLGFRVGRTLLPP